MSQTLGPPINPDAFIALGCVKSRLVSTVWENMMCDDSLPSLLQLFACCCQWLEIRRFFFS
jgi:hypothetical protein